MTSLDTIDLRTTIVNTLTFAALPGSLLAAPAAAQDLGPTLILEDSVVLQESEGHYIGQPGEMVLGPRGSYVVIDFFSANAIRFDGAGRPVRTFGRRGQGPGEFYQIGIGGFVSDGVVGITDGQPPQMQIEFFDWDSGEHLGQARSDGLVSSLGATRRGRLWAGGINPDTWLALGSRRLRELLRDRVSLQPPGIPLERIAVPRPYVEDRTILGIGGHTRMHVSEESILFGFGLSPFLLRLDLDGEVVDTIPLRSAKRRGVPADDEFIEMMSVDDEDGEFSTEEYFALQEELFAKASTLMRVSRDEAGDIHTIHQDGALSGMQVSGTLYLSSLSHDGTRQCPDTLIPTSDVGRPITALRDKELLVLDQRIEAGTDNLRTVLRRFTIDFENCTGEVRRPG